MLTFTFGDLRNPFFHQALGHLADVKALPGEVGYNIAKIFKAVADEEKIVQGLFEKAVEPFLEKDKDGKKVQGGKPGEWKVVDGKTEELNELMQKFHESTVTIDRPAVAFEKVAASLTPRDMALLSGLLSEPVGLKAVPAVGQKRR